MMLVIILSLLVGSRGVYGHGHCRHTQTFPLVSGGLEGHVVRFNGQECDSGFNHLQSYAFCEDSGWGDKEATVVCRDQLYSLYGIGGYLHTHPMEVGLAYVNCSGTEGALEECAVATTTTITPCSQAGIVRQCLNVSQVYVSRTGEYESLQHLEVSEGEAAQLCLIVWGPLSETLHVLLETTDSGYAVANFDYRPLRQTVTFEATESLRSQQCLEIEIVDDSLAEFWEMFSLTISTNSSTVNLTQRELNVYIHPDASSCAEGSLIAVRDADNSSLQLVEACDSSKGVWTPLCDNNWTPQDVAVICRILGYQDSDTPEFSTLHREHSWTTTTTFECIGNETSLDSCAAMTVAEATCQLLLVDCEKTDDSPNTDDGIGNGTDVGNENGAINVGDERGKEEDDDAGENEEEGGDDKDSGTGGDNKDLGNDASSGDGKAGDGKNNGRDRDVLSSGSGTSPTIDNTEERTSAPPPDILPTTEGVSVEVFSAVASSVVMVLLLTLTAGFLMVYVRRKRKKIATAQVGDSTDNHQSNGECMEGKGGGGGGKGEKHLDNPTYDGSLESPNCPQAAEIPEHNVINPLYDLSTDSAETRLYAVLEGPDYAVLECPNYAVPSRVCGPTDCAVVDIDDDCHNYDYADIPDGKTNNV